MTVQQKPRGRWLGRNFVARLGEDKGIGLTVDDALDNLANARAARIQRENNSRRAHEHVVRVKDVAADFKR